MNGAVHHRLALGTAQWGLPYGIANRSGPPSADEVAEIVAVAADRGIRTVDTARAYGRAEEVVGRAVPADWRIVTKLAPDVAGADVASADAMRRARASLAASRAALGVDRLDAVLLHRDDHRRASDGAAWEVLREERHGGGIGAIGVSVVDVADAEGNLADDEIEVLQVPASLLDRRLERTGFFERAAVAGREVFVRSIYLQGAAHLDARALPAHLDGLGPVLEALDDHAADSGAARWELFLAWARRRTAGARIVVGGETLAQVAGNLAAWDRTDLDEVLDAVEDRLPDVPAAILDPWRWTRG